MSVRAGFAGHDRWGQILINLVPASNVIVFLTRCARRWDRAPNNRTEHGIGLRDSLDDFVAGSDLGTVVSPRRTAGTPSRWPSAGEDPGHQAINHFLPNCRHTSFSEYFRYIEKNI